MRTSQATILAGGLGTRLLPFTETNPKPMIEVAGVPFLEHLILQIKSFGIRRVLCLLGYLPEKIMDYFGDGSAFGVEIKYSVTPTAYDTGSRLRATIDELDDEFLLMYCDNYAPIDFSAAERSFHDSDSLIQITVYANEDGYTKDNLIAENNRVIVYDKTRKSENLHGVDIGYAFVKREVLERIPDENVNFEATVYPGVVAEGRMGAYLTRHRYYSIGSWERMALTEEFFRPKKVVFLDRDGTLNERPPKADYVRTPAGFVWLKGAIEAVRLLKNRGYQIYIVTNQPGIARGKLTEETLGKIHEKMRRDLSAAGADVDGIYHCPHGWDEGCDCRKPAPGMLYAAQREHSLSLPECVLIGDDERDIAAGKAAGIRRNILIGDGFSLWDAVQDLY